mgnify:CR=1 FL=1
MSAVGNPPLRSPLAQGDFTAEVWQRWFAEVARNIHSIQVLSPALDPASVAANTVVRQTFTVSGLTVEDVINVNPPALTAGLEILNCRVTATDTIQITFWNSTGAPIDAGSQTYLILAVRP